MNIPTQRDLLASIRRERAALDAAVARVGEARMEEPTLDDGWSVKDILIHICAWERIGMATVRNNQPIETPPTGEPSTGTTDVINQRIYENNRDRPLSEVVADAEHSHAEIIALVQTLSDERLAAVLGVDAAALDAMDVDGPTAAQIISGNSDQHYREHAEQIARWLDGA